MVEIKLVRITESRLGKLLELSEKIWLPTFAPLFSEKELQTLYKGMYSNDKLKAFINRADCAAYFIIREKKEIGYLAIEWREQTLWLDKIYVLPELQGKGIGKYVLNLLESMGKGKQLKSISLRVNRRNEKTIRFYKILGFQIDASVDYPAPNGFVYDDYLMSKKLV